MTRDALYEWGEAAHTMFGVCLVAVLASLFVESRKASIAALCCLVLFGGAGEVLVRLGRAREGSR